MHFFPFIPTKVGIYCAADGGPEGKERSPRRINHLSGAMGPDFRRDERL